MLLHTGRVPEFTAAVTPSLALGNNTLSLAGYECVYDLAVAGDRIVALCEGAVQDTTVTLASLDLEVVDCWYVDESFTRVAVTRSAVFVANAGDVMEVSGTSIAKAPIDLAATADALAIVDARGVTFHDAHGELRGAIPLFAPTAIAVDPIEPGWLVASDGGVFHLRGPGDSPRLLAPSAEPIAKVRRDADTVYVLVGKTLRAITGERQTDLFTLDDNAWYWNDFDAGPGGLHVHGGTPLATSAF